VLFAGREEIQIMVNSFQNRHKTEESMLAFFNQLEALKALSKLLSQTGKQYLVNLADDVGNLVRWINRPRTRFSDQNSADFNEELWRLKMFGNFLQKSDQPEAISALALFNKSVPLDEKQKAALKETWKKIGNGLGIDDNERVMILKAMRLNKGHWYKCPNGHVYAIGDCGGATVESKCPECGATIGGGNHALRRDNAVATEMDGARHSAWSDQANMGNYDLQNLL